MQIKEVIDRTTNFFKDKKFSSYIQSPRLEAELLLAHGLKLERIQLYVQFDRPLKEEELQQCRELVKRRSQGEPLAYITGEKGFYNSVFKVNKHTLIPRPETEILVEHVINYLKKNNYEKPIILELGVGTGCIGLSIIKEIPEAFYIGVEKSEEALKVAQENAIRLKMQDRSYFINEDAENFESVITNIKNNLGVFFVHALVSNPPYIAENDGEIASDVLQFEPHEALFAPEQGLGFIKSWSKNYSELLISDGICMMEMGYKQGDKVKEIFQNNNQFGAVETIKDLSGLDRFVKASKK